MKIVIDIPEKLYEYMTQEEPVTMSNKEAAQWFVRLHKRIFIDGTILPKGHGRLIDADELESVLKNKAFDKARSAKFYEIVWAQKQVHNAQTILEADKEE